MKVKLFINAITKYLCGVIITGALIFLPAGSLLYINGWFFMGIMFVPMLIAGIVMMVKNPVLLEKRLNFKEKQKEQVSVVALSGVMFALGFVVSGLGYRLNLYLLPKSVSAIGAVVFLVSYIIYAEVMKGNEFLSRTVEIQEKQRVIDTGLYGVVRHPMYAATILLFLSVPLVLGSLYSLFIFLLYPLIIVKRIKFEEQLLEKELSGYSEYKKKVKYRLIPYVW